jgi:hypothetical protein
MVGLDGGSANGTPIACMGRHHLTHSPHILWAHGHPDPAPTLISRVR